MIGSEENLPPVELVTGETILDCSVPDDVLPDHGSLDLSTLPAAWTFAIEGQFLGKAFGLAEFGQDFKTGLLVQIAYSLNAIERAFDSARATKCKLALADYNEIIDLFDRSGRPATARPYVQPIIIPALKTEVGKAYLKSLQMQGQMMGTKYDDLVAALASAQATFEAAIEAGDQTMDVSVENMSVGTTEQSGARAQNETVIITSPAGGLTV